jgi:hypothetical protein
MSSPSDELAKKKARLAELRRAKEARLLAGDAANAPGAPAPVAAVPSVDQILASVGLVAPAAPVEPATPTPLAPHALRAPGGRGSRPLSISEAVVVDIPGRGAVEVYEKVTQTDAGPEDGLDRVAGAGRATEGSGCDPHVAADAAAPGAGAGADGEGAEPKPVEVMSESEWQMLQRDEDFGEFFWKSTKIMERALGLQHAYDILKDYSADTADPAAADERSSVLRRHGTRTLFAPQRCAGRPVSCLEWSPHHPELLLAAYHVSQEAPGGFGGSGARGTGSAEDEGLVCVWNTRSGQYERPEYTLSCEAAVTALCVHR